MSSDSYRDLHDDAYREWKENSADEFAAIQRRAFKAGFEAAAEESQNFRHLRQWLEEQRDDAMQQFEDSDQEDDFMHIRAIAFRNVLVKLSEMGCMPDDIDIGPVSEAGRRIVDDDPVPVSVETDVIDDVSTAGSDGKTHIQLPNSEIIVMDDDLTDEHAVYRAVGDEEPEVIDD